MKTESNIKPKSFEIKVLPNDTTELNFTKNIEEVENGNYIFDFYSVIVPTRKTLNLDVEHNYARWLELAKKQ